MTKAFDIIQGPIITEKTMALKENFNKYTFKVAKSANKIEIKNAVEEIFKVKVESVNTINVRLCTTGYTTQKSLEFSRLF